MAQRKANLGTRQAVWDALMQSYWSWPLLDQLIGLPAGERPTIFAAFVTGYREWTVSIHSQYYGNLAVGGSARLADLCLLLATLLFRCARGALRQVNGQISPAMGVAICLAIGIIGYSYEVRAPEECLMLSLAYIAAQKKHALRLRLRRVWRLTGDPLRKGAIGTAP